MSTLIRSTMIIITWSLLLSVMWNLVNLYTIINNKVELLALPPLRESGICLDLGQAHHIHCTLVALYSNLLIQTGCTVLLSVVFILYLLLMSLVDAENNMSHEEMSAGGASMENGQVSKPQRVKGGCNDMKNLDEKETEYGL